MFTSAKAAAEALRYQREHTLKVLDQLTDESLGQRPVDGVRSLGEIAWHIAITIAEMGTKSGFTFSGPGTDEHEMPPGTAVAIREAYATQTNTLVEHLAKLDDAGLAQEHDFYGSKWTVAFALGALLQHEIHHRGQLTVLMRGAGLTVPGMFGPAKEEWANMGMEPPPY